MKITFVNADGATASVDSKLSIRQMIDLRVDEGLSLYAAPSSGADNVALRAGLSYVQLEALRRSPEWREASVQKIKAMGSDLDINDPKTQKLFGVMGATRKTRPTGPREGITKGQLSDIGEHVVSVLTPSEIPEDRMVTMVAELRAEKERLEAEIAVLRKKTAADMVAELRAEKERLEAEIAALKAGGDD